MLLRDLLYAFITSLWFTTYATLVFSSPVAKDFPLVWKIALISKSASIRCIKSYSVPTLLKATPATTPSFLFGKMKVSFKYPLPPSHSNKTMTFGNCSIV